MRAHPSPHTTNRKYVQKGKLMIGAEPSSLPLSVKVRRGDLLVSRGPKVNYDVLIQRQAVLVFGNKAKAKTWLNQPKTAFGNATPLAFANSEAGYLSVKDELERISQGYAS